MQDQPIFPQYAVFAGVHFTAYLSEFDRCLVSAPDRAGFAAPSIRWEHMEYMPWLDNQPTLVADADHPDYVQTLCTEAEFRAAYQAAKEALEANEARWLTPKAVRYATTAQKSEIVRLLNSPRVGRMLKTLVLLRIDKYTLGEAAEQISKLDALIECRENDSYEVTGEAFTVKAA